MQKNVCCFIGHRTIIETDEMKKRLLNEIEMLIKDKNVDTFLFGSKSQFDSLCLDLVTRLKEKYSHIKRIYIRAEYPVISEDFEKYLLKSYDETYFPEKIIGAGKASYVKRNYEMIDKSNYCVFHYNENYTPNHKSGTKIALDYAVKHEKKIIFI